jgi:molybdopterin molybdotransferase
VGKAAVAKVGVVIVSDRAARGERPDECLAVIREWAESRGHEIARDVLVTDEQPEIERALVELCDADCDVVFAAGGTGFSPRDVTPEATLRVVERLTPGVDETLRRLSYEITPMAALSRAVSGIRGRTLVIDLPGSPRAVAEQLAMLDSLLPHGLHVIRGGDHAGATRAAVRTSERGAERGGLERDALHRGTQDAHRAEYGSASQGAGRDAAHECDLHPAGGASGHAVTRSEMLSRSPHATRGCRHEEERASDSANARRARGHTDVGAAHVCADHAQHERAAHAIDPAAALTQHQHGVHAAAAESDAGHGLHLQMNAHAATRAHQEREVVAPQQLHPPRRVLVERDDALARIVAVLPDRDDEDVLLARARGRVVVEDVFARADDPAFARSAMDGYAFPEALVHAKEWLPVAATIQAGDTPAPWTRDDAVARILTGAPLGPGLVGVIPQEDVDVEETSAGRRIRFREQVNAGDCVRPAGHSLPRGTCLARRGTRLGPAELAVLTSAGETMVRVSRGVRVAIASTGDEVMPLPSDGVESIEPLPPGKIYDSNTPMLAALLAADGVEHAGTFAVPDTLDATIAALRDALDVADVVLTMGGISVGDRDHVAPALHALQAEEIVRGVNFRPGRPFSAFRVRDKLVLALPGNPLSVLATYVLFVRPVLDRMVGSGDTNDAPRAVLDEPVENPGARWWAALARLRAVGETLHATVDTISLDSGSLLPLTRTNGFVLLSPNARCGGGESVPAFPLLRGSLV